MYDEYRMRMSKLGSYMGETMRKQTGLIVDATWANSITARPVCIQYLNTGLPKVYTSPDDFEETIWAHFESIKTYSVGGNAVDFQLVFRPHELDNHPEIKVGAYVNIPNVHGRPEQWLIVHIAEDNDLIKARILKTNWILKWVADGKIYNCLGVLRGGNADVKGIEDVGYITSVDSTSAIWLPTNYDSRTIGMNTRFLISDEGRIPPLAWIVSRLRDTTPIGLTQVSLNQDVYVAQNDNAELMIADYYAQNILPEEPRGPETDDGISTFRENSTVSDATITYTGAKPTVKVGGSFKTFTATFSNDDVKAKSWAVVDGVNDVTSGTEDYMIEYDSNNNLRLKVAQNYYLIGKVLTIQVVGTDGSTTEVQIEIIG